MVDFANGNLCGASKQLNDVLSKLADGKLTVVVNLESAASEAASVFAEAQNELNALTAKLQTIVIPKIPKLNLQSEVASLLAQAVGTVAYTAALAKLALEFKDDIEAKGLTLDTLVAISAVASDVICKVVPNLEKEAGSTDPAVELPAAVKQAAAKAVTEAASKVTQNADVLAKTKELVEKIAGSKTTAIPPSEDTPKFKLVPSSIIKTISTGAGSAVPVAVQPTSVAERKNYVSADKAAGFSYKKAKIVEYFSVGGGKHPKLIGSGTTVILPLKHTPTGNYLSVAIYPGENYTKEYISDRYLTVLGLTEESSDANKQFTYPHLKGRHLAWIILHPTATAISNDWSIDGNLISITSPVPLSDHPGNIDSGGYYGYDNPDSFGIMGYEQMMKPGRRLSLGERRQSDKKLNGRFGGVAVACKYEYLEQYDPDYEPV